MSTVAFGNWEMQADDPGDFAFRLAFLPNPHGSDDRATEEDRESWGAFSIWAHGENCALTSSRERDPRFRALVHAPGFGVARR